MVPVRLKLRNFLSYGEAAEPLDFEQFQVACLSGGNGQGKSALLDAMTWALWGQARKSSENRKPDEELLRIGSREMAVELVFELEGQRFRVVRTYQRSASGKTSKPGLEFQAQEAGGGWRPLTGTSVSDTQSVIEQTIRLDYDTFINSAFLLQGRSDEFTKKKPSERKEILARVLGLDRFSHLERAAKVRASDAGARVKAAEVEIVGLKERVAEETAWREDLAAVEALAEDYRQRVAALRAQATALTEALAELDALARHTEHQRERLAALAARRREMESERADLARRIETADALIQQADAIHAAHERHQALSEERSGLDDLREQQQGLHNQRLRLREELQLRRRREEDRLTHLDARQSTDRNTRDELRQRLTRRPAVKQALAEAEAAAAESAALRAQFDARKQVETRVEAIQKELAHERGALQGTINGHRKRVQEAKQAATRLPGLRSRCTELSSALQGVEEVREALEATQAEGVEVASRLEVAKREVERLAAEADALKEKTARIDRLETETCPTCSTPLTDDHRAEVKRTYAEELEALAAKLRQAAARVEALSAERSTLLARFKEIRGQVLSFQRLEEELARVRLQLEAAEQAQAEADAIQQELQRLEEQLVKGLFKPALSAELAELQDRLADTPFDENRYEKVRERAAQRPRFQGELRDLEAETGRLEGLEQQIEAREGELGSLREALASGTVDGPLREELEVLEERIRGLGYDGERHDAVRRELRDLAEAPRRYVELAGALNNVADWKERRARLARQIETAETESETLRESVSAAETRLAERPTRAAEQAELTAALADAEAELRRAQTRRGALQERLGACERDRQRLTTLRADHREARRERSLYNHLRRAFGRDGIPALIIEQTIPEVEERANELLERLSNGRTRVHLETLRDKKTGGTKETLDIRITDEHGVSRSYETFSGGEAFRVNFALRIALAQLLADRAGVRIRTLVVDEGFGTQDKQGVEALVDVIQAIRDSFEKVLVITHLDELKEAFPVRIEVDKHPVDGSRYDVVGV